MIVYSLLIKVCKSFDYDLLCCLITNTPSLFLLETIRELTKVLLLANEKLVAMENAIELLSNTISTLAAVDTERYVGKLLCQMSYSIFRENELFLFLYDVLLLF